MRLSCDNPKSIDKVVLVKYIYLLKRLNLEPKALITYKREALQGLDDPRLRVTFDMNVRSYLYTTVTNKKLFR